MPQTFRELIADNKRNSVLLVVVFCLFVTLVAMVLGLGLLAYSGANLSRLNWIEGLGVGVAAGVISLLLSLVGYYAGNDMILAVSGAQPIRHDDDPELFNVVEEMAIAAGIPMPHVYLIHDSAPNAMATGRDPKHAVVAITTGLRSKLTRDELQGVIAHEVSHIRNYDIRLMLLMAVLVGSVVMLCDFFWQILRWGPSGGRKSSKDGGGGVIFLIILVVAVVLAIIAPLLAQLIQFAVSRQREYLADASAVELTRYPQGLANALRKIDADPADLQSANRGTAHLYIANPIKKFEARATLPSPATRPSRTASGGWKRWCIREFHCLTVGQLNHGFPLRRHRNKTESTAARLGRESPQSVFAHERESCPVGGNRGPNCSRKSYGRGNRARSEANSGHLAGSVGGSCGPEPAEAAGGRPHHCVRWREGDGHDEQRQPRIYLQARRSQETKNYRSDG